jgi:hypothetical protein
MSRVVRVATAAMGSVALALVTGCGLLELGEPVDPEPAAVLPDAWPQQFPDPPAGAVLVRVTHLESDANPGMFAHLEDAEVEDYYEVLYEIDEGDIVALFDYYRDAFGAAGWHDLEIADDPHAIVTDHTGFTFHGYGVRGHLALFTGDEPAGITVHLQILR